MTVFKTIKIKQRNSQCKGPHQLGKSQGISKNNQYGVLENLGDAENIKEQGKELRSHSSKGFDHPPKEPIINPKVDKKEDVSAEEEGVEVKKFKEKDGGDSEDTEEEDVETNKES